MLQPTALRQDDGGGDAWEPQAAFPNWSVQEGDTDVGRQPQPSPHGPSDGDIDRSKGVQVDATQDEAVEVARNQEGAEDFEPLLRLQWRCGDLLQLDVD